MASMELIDQARQLWQHLDDLRWHDRQRTPRPARLAWLARARHCRRLGMLTSAEDCRRMAEKYR